ncbi:MAG: (2Fe-2S)-binding protein [Candidatus Aminicenantes bacterium]|nr:(2Fe-2S)-binding protein [Candidatus Aminicenantes bacterium]
MKLIIDNQEREIRNGLTVLEAVEEHNIYIPHLCSHPELTSYGGCRLCIVEIEGIKGYATACTQQAKKGMVVHTKTKALQKMRKEIIQLILSDHPAGCLICDEEEECKEYQATIRKVGATTGCRWCPKDDECELQKVVNYLKIKDIIFPVYYQGFPVEKYDPFFDRDYNLCIYCGRCVRICQEHRRSSVISMSQRGKSTAIGPAFHLTHIEADCEFCGACVSVCPTGAMSEKNKKWSGIPDSYKPYICTFCGLNCDIQMLIKNNKIAGSIPPGEPHQSGGELCVRGRFCLSEWVNNPDRVFEPQYKFPEGVGIVSWKEAIQHAAEKLKSIPKEQIAVFLSPFLTMEELAAAKILFEEGLNTSNITSSVLETILVPYFNLVGKSIPLKKIEKSDCIISFFLNGNYNYGPLTLAIKRAAEKGTPYYQIGWFKDTTSRFAKSQIIPPPGQEKTYFSRLLQHLEKGTGGASELKNLLTTLKNSSSPIIILGPEILDLVQAGEIIQIIEKIIAISGAQNFVPDAFGNLTGLLSLFRTRWNSEIQHLITQGKIDLLYIIGDSPFLKRPDVDFIIQQSTFPPSEELPVDLLLPVATWGEISGTYTGLIGGHRKFRAAVKPPKGVLQNNEIFTLLSKALKGKRSKLNRGEIAKLITKTIKPKFPKDHIRIPKKPKFSSPDSDFPYLLIQEKTPHLYFNTSLSKTVSGMKEIVPEETIIMNPLDATKLGLNKGDTIFVESRSTGESYSFTTRNYISPGFIYLITTKPVLAFVPNPCPVHLRRKNV